MMEVFRVENVRGKKSIPSWARIAIVSDDDVLFVTPAVADISEMTALLCAGWDGTPVINYNEHIYVPADWMKREYPRCVDLVDKISARVAKVQSDGL
jgi:myo-inositol-hexaphosphate 3-phosphohydrolase